jgi:hypothetical protein
VLVLRDTSFLFYVGATNNDMHPCRSITTGVFHSLWHALVADMGTMLLQDMSSLPSEKAQVDGVLPALITIALCDRVNCTNGLNRVGLDTQ